MNFIKFFSLFVLFANIFSCSKTNSITMFNQQKYYKYSLSILKDTVKIYYDKYDIPHIFAKNDDDLIKTQGYIEAKERLFIMDIFRHAGNGSLSEMLGDFNNVTIQLDWFIRLFFISPRGKPVAEEIINNLDSETEIILNNFIDGINYYLYQLRNGEKVYFPKEYMLFKIKPENIPDFTIKDIVGIVRAFTFINCYSFDTELKFSIWSNILNKAGKEKILTDIMIPTPIGQSITLPYSNINTSVVSSTPFSHLSTKKLSHRKKVLGDTDTMKFAESLFSKFRIMLLDIFKNWGSNNFVVSGIRSKTGYAYLANDPHLPLFTPPIFYEFQLDSKTLGNGTIKVSGMTFAGTPGIVFGYNDNIAWGETDTAYDVSDIYAETITEIAGKLYSLYKNNWVEIKEYKQTIRVRKYPDTGYRYVDITIPYIPHHGPLLLLNKIPTEVKFLINIPDSLNGTNAISFKWTGQEPTNEIKTFVMLDKATNINEFKEALNYFDVGSENFVYADIKGNIAFYPHAQIPIRPLGTKPWLIMDGTGSEEWLGYYSNNEIPQVTNQKDVNIYNKRGYIATANNDQIGVTLDGNPINEGKYLYYNIDIGFRQTRISNLLETGISQNSIDLNYMEKVQTDTYSLYGKMMLDIIFNKVLSSNSAKTKIEDLNLQPIIDLLKSWNYSTPTGTGDQLTGQRKISNNEAKNSAAASIYHAWIKRFVKHTLYDEFEAYGLPYPGKEWGPKILYNLLKKGEQAATWDPTFKDSTLFDDIKTSSIRETSTDIALQSLMEAIDFWKKKVGNNNYMNFRWGIVHKSFFINPYIFKSRGPYPRKGGDFTVNVGDTPTNGTSFTNTHGAAMRFVIEMRPNKLRAFNALPGYNTGYYEQNEKYDQMSLWIHNRFREMPYYISELEENCDHIVEFIPK